MSINLAMLFLDQMKLLGLIGLLSTMVCSKGQDWNIFVPRRINATLGSTVIVKCNFTYPVKHFTNDVQIYWKTEGTKMNTPDKDKNPFVYHPNETYMLHEYRGRVKLIGDKNKQNCSLKIKNITNHEPMIYMRLDVKEKYSFKRDTVSIVVTGFEPLTPVPVSFTEKFMVTTYPTTTELTSQSYVAIFVPLSFAFLVIIVAGIVFYIKHKRPHSFSREESGYYANFSRAPSNQAQREESCKNTKNKELNELKVIDEPVYVNTETLAGQPDQRTEKSMDQTDHVYGNIDYSK